MALTQSQLDAANELFNRGLNTDGQPLSDQQKQSIQGFRQRGLDPAKELLDVPSPGAAQLPATARFGGGLLGGLVDPFLRFGAAIQQQQAPFLQRLAAISPAAARVAAPTVQIRPTEMPLANGAPAKVGRFVGETLPYLLPYLWGERALLAAPTAARLAGRLAMGAGIGVTQAPRQPISGAVTGIAAQTAAEAINPLFAGLGLIARQPLNLAKKSMTRMIAAMPGGLEGVKNVITGRLGNIANTLRGDSTADSVQQDVFNKLKSTYNANRDAASAAFDEVNKNPAAVNFKFSLPKTANVINEEIDKLKPKIKLSEGTDDPDLESLQDLQKWLIGKKNVANKVSNLSESKIFREGLSKSAKNLPLIERNPELKAFIPKFKNALDAELESNIEGSGNEQLLKSWQNANRQYRDFQNTFRFEPGARPGKEKFTLLSNLVTQQKPEISKLFTEHIKPSVQKDETAKIQQLFNWLPDQGDRNKVAYNLIRTGEDNPDLFMKSYNKLGSKQKDLLFGNNRAELDQVQELHKRFPSAFQPPKEMGPFGKLAKTTQIIGGLAAAPFTHGASLGVAAAPLVSGVGRGGRIDQAIFEDLLNRISTDRTGALARALRFAPITRPLIAAPTLAAATELQRGQR